MNDKTKHDSTWPKEWLLGPVELGNPESAYARGSDWLLVKGSQLTYKCRCEATFTKQLGSEGMTELEGWIEKHREHMNVPA